MLILATHETYSNSMLDYEILPVGSSYKQIGQVIVFA